MRASASIVLILFLLLSICSAESGSASVITLPQRADQSADESARALTGLSSPQTGTADPATNFTITLLPAVQLGLPGQSVTFTANVTARTGWTCPVALNFTFQDQNHSYVPWIGATARLTPTQGNDNFTSTLTVSVGEGLTGTYGILIDGTVVTPQCTEEERRSAMAILQVMDPGFSISVPQGPLDLSTEHNETTVGWAAFAVGGYPEQVALQADVPMCASVPCLNVVVPTSAASSGYLTVIMSPSTPNGSYTIRIRGTDHNGRQNVASMRINVNWRPQFDVQISPSSLKLAANESADFSLSVAGSAGLNVALDKSGIEIFRLNPIGPASDVAVSVLPMSGAPPFSALLRVSVGPYASPGDYLVSIIARDTEFQELSCATTRLVVVGSAFSFLPDQLSNVAVEYGTANFTISVKPVGGWNQSVHLLPFAPPGLNCAITQQGGDIPPFYANLVVNVSGGVPVGSYPVVVVSGSNDNFTTGVILVVNVEIPSFDVKVSPPSQQVMPGGSAKYDVKVSSTLSLPFGVSLSVHWQEGSPSGTRPSVDNNNTRPSFLSTLTLTIGEDAQPREYKFIVVGSYPPEGESVTRVRSPAILIVAARPGPSALVLVAVVGLLFGAFALIVDHRNTIWTRKAVPQLPRRTPSGTVAARSACNRCGHANRAGAKFCTNCGSRLLHGAG